MAFYSEQYIQEEETGQMQGTPGALQTRRTSLTSILAQLFINI